MAQKPPTGKDARHVTAEALQAKVDIDAGDFYVRIGARGAELLSEGARRGLLGDALADFVIEALRELTDGPIERAGRESSSEPFNLGKNLEAQRRAPEIGLVVRSAVLDGSCDPCVILDGTVCRLNGPVVDATPQARAFLIAQGVDPDSPNAYVALLPPNFCEGWDACRCQPIYEREAA